MNKNETLILWLSVGLAIFSVMLIYSYTQEKSDELTRQFGTKTSIVTSNRDINEMETIDESMLQLQEIPVDFAQPGYITDMEDAIGLVALAPIQAGEQILSNKIVQPGPVTGLSLQVTPQNRALTIPVDDMRGVAKLIKPGDRIDILATLDLKSRGSSKHVKTVLQDVVILATGLNIMNELPRLRTKSGSQEFIENIRAKSDFSTITIEASPQEIQELVYILSTSPSALFVTLRHPTDRLRAYVPHTTGLDQIVGKKLSQKAKKPKTITRKRLKLQ